MTNVLKTHISRDEHLRLQRAGLLGRTALCGVLSVGVWGGLGFQNAGAGPDGTTVVSGTVTTTKSGSTTTFKPTPTPQF